MSIGQDAFSNIGNQELDEYVRDILEGILWEGGLRARGLRIQTTRVRDSIARVNPVMSVLGNTLLE